MHLLTVVSVQNYDPPSPQWPLSLCASVTETSADALYNALRRTVHKQTNLKLRRGYKNNEKRTRVDDFRS